MIWGKLKHLIPKITFLIYNIGWNWEMKHLSKFQNLPKQKHVLIVTVSVPHMANAMPIQMVKTAP